MLQFLTFDLVGGMLTGNLSFDTSCYGYILLHASIAVHLTKPASAMMLFLAFMMTTDGMAEMHR